MANAVYPKWKEAILQAEAGADLDGDVRAVLVDLDDYTYDAAHDFLDDIPAGARVAVSSTIGSKTFTNGAFDMANFAFSSVTGDVSEAVVIYLHTGTDSTSRLVAFFDTGVTGLPVTPNGGDINVAIDGSGVFSL